MQGSFKLGRLFGIEVRIHATWILAFVVVSWGLASLVLAAIFWALGRAIGPLPGLGALLGSPRFVATTSPVVALIGYLAFANLALGVFNLLPAFPLDGGRVRRSIVWQATGNYERATSAAAILGQGLAFALIAFGIVRVVTGDFGGIWTAFIGWFLSRAAGATRREQTIRTATHEPPTTRPSVAW
jgi:Zn-dependent protease